MCRSSVHAPVHKILHVDDSRLLPFILCVLSSRSFASHFGRSLWRWPHCAHCSGRSQASELTMYRPLFQVKFAFCFALASSWHTSRRREGSNSTSRKAVVSNHCSSLESYCICGVGHNRAFSPGSWLVRSKAKGYRCRRSQFLWKFLSLLFLRLLWLHICHWKSYVERKDAEFGT